MEVYSTSGRAFAVIDQVHLLIILLKHSILSVRIVYLKGKSYIIWLSM